MLKINNKTIRNMVQNSYTPDELEKLYIFLCQKKTFNFPMLDNGLFPAAVLLDQAQYTGYSYIWVRDNIHIAYTHYINGQIAPALKNLATFAEYFIVHKWRFQKILTGELDHNDPMNRPHIRFNGYDCTEVDQKWAHAENDALGYFLWFFSLVYEREEVRISDAEIELLALFVLYFDRINYWEDEDSGHWEETRKIESSSIGVVIGALRQLKAFIINKHVQLSYDGKPVTAEFIDLLIDKGEKSLYAILPYECCQIDSLKNRRYDSALLFLIYPLKVLSGNVADQVLSDVIGNLKGEYGIRRYIGDSYWAQDYKKNLQEAERTIDFSDNVATRDKLLNPGSEAQWCIFDPIISIIYGLRYQSLGNAEYLQSQIWYFNRSLGQLTSEESVFGGFKCPEMYYLENGRYVPNDTVPLLWTQANLWSAFKYLKENCAFCKNSVRNLDVHV